jgi:hypothetical protein
MKKLPAKTLKIETEQLIQVVGLKRSGLHALSFWLLGHQSDHVFINNSPLKRSGDESPMSRTIRDCPLPVPLHWMQGGARSRNSQEEFVRVPRRVKLLVVLFQSQSLRHLGSHSQWVEGVRAKKVATLLLLRDPYNWSASYKEKSKEPQDDSVWPELWMEYAREFTGRTNHLAPSPLRVNYNRWFRNLDYRKEISDALGLEFTDRNLEVVTDHAGGSSFDKTDFSGSAQEMKVMERWKMYQDDSSFRDAFRANPQIAKMTEEIFELPQDLERFSEAVQ